MKTDETTRLARVIFGESSPQAKSAELAAERRRKRNEARKARNQAMRDLGLVRVKGSLGGTYWE